MVVMGDVPSMGSFTPSQAVTLHTDPEIYPLWRTTQPVVVPFGIRIQYKYASKLGPQGETPVRANLTTFSQSSLEEQSDNGSQ